METVQDSAAARAEQYDLYLIERKVLHERMARQEHAVGVAVCLAVFAAELFSINRLWPWVTPRAASNPLSEVAFLVITLGIAFGVWALVWCEFVTPLIRGHYSKQLRHKYGYK